MSERKFRLLLFVYSTANIVGSTLGIIGLLLFFTGVIKSFWLFIVIGLYAIGFFATPRNEALSLTLSQQLNTQALIESLKQLVESVSRRLSPQVMEPLKQLRDTVVEILPNLDKFDGASYQLHSVKQTITDYLPDMLETYLKLPPAYARFHVMKSGHTPRDSLIEQLTLLNKEMSKILESIHAHDVDELLVMEQFLKDKYSAETRWE